MTLVVVIIPNPDQKHRTQQWKNTPLEVKQNQMGNI